MIDTDVRSPSWISERSSNLLLFKLITPIAPSPLKTTPQNKAKSAGEKTDLIRTRVIFKTPGDKTQRNKLNKC